MSVHSVTNALAGCVAAAMLTGCGGLQSPIGGPGAGAQSWASPQLREHGQSWIAPEAKGQDLLYISDQLAGGVFVYTYQPPRYKFEGLLTEAGTPGGECVDRAQDIFVTNYSVTFEYRHGSATAIRVLGDPGGSANSCSVDPTTGNLAVTAGSPGLSDHIAIAIYKNGRGRPALISASDFSYMAFCTYDDRGNLFIDGGHTDGNAFLVEELPKGASGLVPLDVEKALQYPGGMQWLGDQLLIGDVDNAVVYRFSINGHKAHATGSTHLTGSPNIDQYLVTGSRLIEPSGNVSSGSGWVNVYSYPAGGSPTRNLPNFGLPYAVVISRA